MFLFILNIFLSDYFVSASCFKLTVNILLLLTDITRNSFVLTGLFLAYSGPANFFLSRQYPGKKALDIADHPELPAIVRVELWFGLEQHQSNWTAREQSEGEFGVLAETVS